MDSVPPDENPLSQADYRSIQSAYATLNRARRKLERAIAAAVPCDDRSGQCDYIQDRLDKLKATFFPHKP